MSGITVRTPFHVLTRTCIGLVLFALLASSQAFGQTLSGGLGDNFTNAMQIGTQGGTITQLAFDPNDADHLYAVTWFSGVVRFDYSEDGSISNPVQVVDASAGLNANGANGSLGIAFHNDPMLGSVMYLSRATPNDSRGEEQALGSIVRLTDSDGDGTWGNGSDVNQTIAENIYVADWSHQINQFAVHEDTLYVGIGSMSTNGGVIGTGGDHRDPGESAHTATIVFIEDLTALSNDTSTTNIAWYDFDVVDDGEPLSDADADVYQQDTQAFTSDDPGKFRIYATGFRNNFGIGVDGNGIVWASNNGGGEASDADNLPDALYAVSFRSDYSFPKANIEVGDWKDPDNSHPSARAAQGEGYFQTIIDPPFALLGQGTAVTGLDFVTAPGNDFDGHIVVARHSNDGQDVVLVDPNDGSFVNLLNRANGVRPTDVLVDPFGNLLVSYSTNQIHHIDVTGGVGFATPGPGEPVYSLGIDFGSIAPAGGTNFNQFDLDTDDGETETLPAGSLIDLEGNTLAGISFSLTNDTGQDTTRANVTSGQNGDGNLIVDASVFEDSYISNNQAAAPLDADANFVLTFSGLDDSLTYDLSGGFANGNGNFDANWTVGGQTLLAAPGYVGFENLSTDGSGNLEIVVSRETLHVTLGALTLTAKTLAVPEVASLELNRGEAQRSAVESISVVFDGDVTFGPDAVSLVQRSTATAETFVPVTTSVSTQMVDGQTIATIQFTSHTRNPDNALVDGNYQLTLVADEITLNGQPMVEDFVHGDVEADGFYSFYGDSDGNRTLDIFDLLRFRSAFDSIDGDADYEFFLDYGADGVINVFDLLEFRRRFGVTLPFVFGSASSSFSGKSKQSKQSEPLSKSRDKIRTK